MGRTALPAVRVGTRIVNQYTKCADEVGVAIFYFEVEDFYGFGKFQQADALDRCGMPVLGVDNVAGVQVAGIYPALALNLERVGFGTLQYFTVNALYNNYGTSQESCQFKNSALVSKCGVKSLIYNTLFFI